SDDDPVPCAGSVLGSCAKLDSVLGGSPGARVHRDCRRGSHVRVHLQKLLQGATEAMNRNLLIGAVAALAIASVASCQGTPDVRAVNALAITCDAYATGLEQVTTYKANLSAETVKRIDSANAKVKEVCNTQVAGNVADSITLVQQAMTLIKTAQGAM